MRLGLASDLMKVEKDRLNSKSFEKEGLLVGSSEVGEVEINGRKGSETASSLNFEKMEKIAEGLGEGERSSGYGEDEEPVVVQYNLPDVELDGNWGVVICHGDGESMRRGPPVILQINPQPSSSVDFAKREEIEVREDSMEMELDVESFSDDEDKSEVILTPNEGHGSGAQGSSEDCDEDAMLMPMKTSLPSKMESSPNCLVEIFAVPGFEDAEVTEKMMWEKFPNGLPHSKKGRQETKSEISGPAEMTATSPSNPAEVEESIIRNNLEAAVLSSINDVVGADVDLKPDVTTKKRRSTPKKVPKKRKNTQLRRSTRNTKSEGSGAGDDPAQDNNTGRHNSSSVRETRSKRRFQKYGASLPPCSITLARCDKSLRSSKTSRKGSKISSGTTTSEINEEFEAKTATMTYSQLISLPNNVDPSGRMVCPICSRTFVNQGSLRGHFRTHTDDRPYKCPHCTKCFGQAGTRSRHVFAKHEMIEKPHKCPYCPRSFSQVGNMKVHIHSHANEKPYKCSKCSEAFAQGGSLQRHIQINHGEDSSE